MDSQAGKLWSRYGATALLVLLSAAVATAAEPAAKVDFNFHVRPILSDRCYACHGPDHENRQAELQLDTPEGLFKPLEFAEGSHVVKPGEPESSELYLRISNEDESMRMPPAESHLTVSPKEIELIRRWIEQGAEWKDHWSLLPIETVAPPEVAATDWVRNPIDRFVLARLEQERLQPTPAASRERLIRRLSFDLTGLPPTLAELDAFLADESPDAYERVVDRLLASPRFGERMAVDWLDLARYADTYGYQADAYRATWPWRDWVVDSFNQNLPYDKFVAYQLAGDLLPNATDEQILATAFNRLHRQTNEGGSIEEEFRIEYVVDRTNTFGEALLGLSVGCARCHDHKFDPVSQREYYQLSAFFDNIDESGLYSYFTDATPTPTLFRATPEQEAQLELTRQKVAEAEEHVQEVAAAEKRHFYNWWLGNPSEPSPDDTLVADFSFDSIAKFRTPNSAEPLWPGELFDVDEVVEGKHGGALPLTGENSVTTTAGGLFDRHDPFSIALWIEVPERMDRAVVLHRSQAWSDAGSRGYQMLIEDGKLSVALVHFLPGNAIGVRSVDQLPVGRWVHVAFTYDGSSRAAGVKLFVDGRRIATEVIRDGLTKTIRYDKPNKVKKPKPFSLRREAKTWVDWLLKPKWQKLGKLAVSRGTSLYEFFTKVIDLERNGAGANPPNRVTIGQRFRDRGFKGGKVDELKIWQRELAPVEVAVDCSDSTFTLATVDDAERFAYFLHRVSESYAAALQRLHDARAEYDAVVDGVEEIMVMRELAQPRPTHILARGAYDAPTERVEPNTPAKLPPMADDLPRNRLGLARWLTDPSNPLTARVAANRLWQTMFGRGLVATQEDFGSQGELPSHPELLDWLAHKFVASGWDMKTLVKLMVMSATYRQDSDCPPELREADPLNRLLARGASYRLPAEMIRDAALATSGLLVDKLGGPPVKPYQPAGLWKEKSGIAYQRDKGEGSHRRSLYTYWKRTSPPPAMATLDAALREVCIVRRQATATPLQALVLLNDPQYVEAARGLAERTLLESASDLPSQLTFIFRTLTSRCPAEEELAVLRSLYDEQLAYFAADPKASEQFLTVGDLKVDARLDPAQLAALAVVAEGVMNFDECVVKR